MHLYLGLKYIFVYSCHKCRLFFWTGITAPVQPEGALRPHESSLPACVLSQFSWAHLPSIIRFLSVTSNGPAFYHSAILQFTLTDTFTGFIPKHYTSSSENRRYLKEMSRYLNQVQSVIYWQSWNDSGSLEMWHHAGAVDDLDRVSSSCMND